jgi:hypothetical protein
MTPQTAHRLKILYRQALIFDKSSRSIDIYESYKKKLQWLNLTPDEYEQAARKIAEILGL